MRDNLDSALLDIATIYRDVLVAQSGSDEILNIDLKAEVAEFASTTTPKRSIERIEALLEARINLGRNSANTRFAFRFNHVEHLVIFPI